MSILNLKDFEALLPSFKEALVAKIPLDSDVNILPYAPMNGVWEVQVLTYSKMQESKEQYLVWAGDDGPMWWTVAKPTNNPGGWYGR